MPYILEAEDIVAHRGGTAILTAAALRLAPRTITAVAGRNGAGKSTLLNAVAGVHPPTSGRLRVGDVIRWKWRLHQLAADGLFYWPQDGFLSRHLTVRAQLALMRRRWSTPAVLFREVLQGLPGSTADTAPSALSGGERVLVEMALVRLRQPGVLLADEPFTGLAPKPAEQLGTQLRGLADTGTAVCFTSHSWWLVEAFADHVVYCSSRSTHDLGTPASAGRDHAFRRDFLGPAAPAGA